MITQLSQDSVAEYASDAQTIDEPLGTDYSQGVRVGRTIPAKWWNWLFSAVTKRAGQSKSDAQNMLTELQNVVTDAGIPLDATDSTQLSQAIDAKTDAQITDYVTKKRQFISLWYKVNTTGLLPVPTGSGEWTWYLNPRKTKDVYWSTHGIYKLSSGNVGSKNNKVAFSYDLENWWLFDPATVASEFGYRPKFSAGVEFFKGMYYMAIAGVISSGGSNSVYALLKSEDCKSWETVGQYSGYDSTIGAGIFIANNTLYFEYNGHVLYSTDGSTFQAASATNITSSAPILGNCAYASVQKGTKYIVGGVLVDGTSLTKLNPNATYGSLSDTAYPLKQGNVVISSKFTVDSAFNVTPFTASSITGVYLDDQYLIIQKSGGGFAFTEDGITFTDISVATSFGYFAETNGKLFFTNGSNAWKIYATVDLLNWVDTGHIAPAQSLFGVPLANALVSGTKYSLDEGATWGQAKDSDGNDFCGHDVYFMIGNNYYTVWVEYTYNGTGNSIAFRKIYFTVNAINHVVGHTLYLQ